MSSLKPKHSRKFRANPSVYNRISPWYVKWIIVVMFAFSVYAAIAGEGVNHRSTAGGWEDRLLWCLLAFLLWRTIRVILLNKEPEWWVRWYLDNVLLKKFLDKEKSE